MCAFPLNCHALSFTAMCERSFLLWDTTGSFQQALLFSLRTCATLRSSGLYPASGGTSRPCPAFALMASVPLLAVTSPFGGAYVPYARSSRASRGFAALPTGRAGKTIKGLILAQLPSKIDRGKPLHLALAAVHRHAVHHRVLLHFQQPPAAGGTGVPSVYNHSVTPTG